MYEESPRPDCGQSSLHLTNDCPGLRPPLWTAPALAALDAWIPDGWTREATERLLRAVAGAAPEGGCGVGALCDLFAAMLDLAAAIAAGAAVLAIGAAIV